MFGLDDIGLAIGSQLIGGLMQSDSAESAANSQSAASDRALAAQNAQMEEMKRQFDLSRQDSAPWRNAGGAAVGRLASLLGLGNAAQGIPIGYVSPPRPGTGEQYRWNGASWVDMAGNPVAKWDSDSAESLSRQAMQNDPSAGGGELTKKFTLQDFYDDPVTALSMKFGMEQGQRGIENQQRARAMLNSGAALKEITRYGTDYAGQQAGASRGRFIEDQTNTYNRLAGLAGLGQTSAANTGSLGAQYSALGNQGASNIGNLITSMGNARGASQIAGGNALGGAFGNIGNWYNQQKTLNQILGGGGGSGSGLVSPMVPGQFNPDTYG